MSMLAIKLFNEREEKEDNVGPLLRAIYGEERNASEEAAVFLDKALMELDESNPFGLLQRYFVEEYFFHGKSKEQIGQEIADNMALLLNDLEHNSIRFLRRAPQVRELSRHLRKED